MFNRRLLRAAAHLRWLIIVLTVVSANLPSAPATAASDALVHAQPGEAEWLIMIYSAADDNVLEEDMLIDLQEAELVGSTDDVTIVTQIDRFDGGYDGMGDWTTAKRFLVTQDRDMSSIGSEEIEDLGEVNMADGATLLDFIVWAVTTYPAQKRMLILSDHGIGWPGGWSDPDPGGPGPDDITLSYLFDDGLWLMELEQVLDQARRELGLDYFDVIGFDACLMSQLEVYTAMAPHALYSVASQELEPGLGWAYAGFLGPLVADPEMGGDELVEHIVASYIEEDMRLEDPEYVGTLTRQQAAAAITPEITLAAVDLAQIAQLNAALDGFVATLQTLDQNVVAEARAYAQSFESPFGDEFPTPYIDLGHFSQLIQGATDDPAVLATAQELDVALQAAVIAEKHGDQLPGATGIAIHFPVREMYEIADNLGYRDVAASFVETSQWDEFVAFHFGDAPREAFSRPGSSFETLLQTLLPELAPEYVQVLVNEIVAMVEQGLASDEIAQILVDEFELPEDVVVTLFDEGFLGAEPASVPTNTTLRKPLQVTPIFLSAEVAYPDAPVAVEADIVGDRVSFIYSFIGRYLPEEDVLIIEDEDFLFAEQEITVGGVTYPDWPEGSFTVGYDWEPVVYAISDGETAIRTLFSPHTYGEEPTYTVDGIYSFANGSPDRYARLYFQEGELARAFGFVGTNNDGIGAPREITLRPGDQFTVFEQGYDLAEDAAEEGYSAEIGTLTFGEESFYIEETPAPSGNYVVGIIAEDLDGNVVEAYETLFVVGDDGVTDEGFVPLVAEDLGFAFLYPETWAPLDGGDTADVVTLTNADETALMSVWLAEYPDAADATEANLLALDDVMGELANDAGLENFFVADDPIDFTLGLYDAQLVDFSFDLDGIAYAGEVVAATPIPGLTYVVYFDAPAEEAESLLPDLDALLYSFDILVSGIDYAESGAPQPDFDEVLFEDDFSDAESGLYDDLEALEWGQGYYDLGTEQYVYDLNPASGEIYDYYFDAVLPDTFMIQSVTQAMGAMDTVYGLIFQVLDDSHFYAFRVSGDGYFLVEKADGDTWDVLVDWTAVEPFDLAEGAVNTLAVVGTDEFYRLYVNGIQVGEFTDESYWEGSAGYTVQNYDEAVPATLVFDDLIIGIPSE